MARESDGGALNNPSHYLLRCVVPFDTPAEYSRILTPGAQLRIGRGSRNDIVIPNPCVSREHVIIRWDSRGPVLSDLRTRNGTKVNAQRVVADIPLRVGDCIEISSARIYLIAPDGVVDAGGLEPRASDTIGTISQDRNSLITGDASLQRQLGRADIAGPGIRLGSSTTGPLPTWKRLVIIAGGCALGLGLFLIALKRGG